MGIIKIKRGSGIPSGLTFGELAYDTTNKRLYVGITGGNALLANTDGGVASINGATGAFTDVTFNNTSNTFLFPQEIFDNTQTNSIGLGGEVISVNFGVSEKSSLLFFPDAGINLTYTLPSTTTTLSGLAENQTFTGTNTFNTLTNFNAGISSAGGTFSALTRFTAGISASGATLSSNTIIPSGATLSIAGVVSSDNGYRISSNAINAQTGTTYTFLTTDDGKIVTFNNGSAITVTIPTGLPVGFNCTAIQLGAGQVGFTAASGVTLQSYGNQFKLIGQHASAVVLEYSTNIVNLSGNLII